MNDSYGFNSTKNILVAGVNGGLSSKLQNVDQEDILHANTDGPGAVSIGSKDGALGRVSSHIKKFGLRPVRISQKDQHRVMASSQGIITLLCRGTASQLRADFGRGLLTPSGEALLVALSERESGLTVESFSSILHNTRIAVLLEDLIKGAPD